MPLDAVRMPVLPPLIRPQMPKGATLRQRFWLFHEANPHVYQALRAMALQLKRKGYRKMGIAPLYEKLRWDYAMQTDDPTDIYKLGNSYRAFYSRLIMRTTPELEGFLTTRYQPSQEREFTP